MEDSNRKYPKGTMSEIVNSPEARKAKSKIVNPKSGIPYLVGFCHTAQAERVFRLDRIQEITLVPRPNEDGQTWED